MRSFPNPFIEQRADPFILKVESGYYFTASVPLYDRIELRYSKDLMGLRTAETRTVWVKHESGPMSELIWAPEIHFVDGAWYIYFAAAHTREIAHGAFQHRMYCIACYDADPMKGEWVEKGQVVTHLDTFCLDATTFSHRGSQYYLWAQQDRSIPGNSNLYLAKMQNPWTLEDKQVMLSKPEFDWECRGFLVNEGPAILRRNGKIFITYSASATDENYAVGLLWADEEADLLDPKNWHKSEQPIFTTSYENKQYGPGHSCFTKDEDDTDLLVYHCRNYTEIEGDPLWNPDRHCRIKPIEWNENGMPVLGVPPKDTVEA